jgi:hypothetical protein
LLNNILFYLICFTNSWNFSCSSFHIRLGTFAWVGNRHFSQKFKVILLNLLRSFTGYLDAWRQTADFANVTKPKSYQKQFNNNVSILNCVRYNNEPIRNSKWIIVIYCISVLDTISSTQEFLIASANARAFNILKWIKCD